MCGGYCAKRRGPRRTPSTPIWLRSSIASPPKAKGGRKKALIALARHLIVIAYHLIREPVVYRDAPARDARAASRASPRPPKTLRRRARSEARLDGCRILRAAQRTARLCQSRVLNNGVPKIEERRIPAVSGSSPRNSGESPLAETLGIRRERSKLAVFCEQAGRDFSNQNKWLPRNALLQLFLSTFLNVSGGPPWIRTPGRWVEHPQSIEGLYCQQVSAWCTRISLLTPEQNLRRQPQRQRRCQKHDQVALPKAAFLTTP